MTYIIKTKHCVERLIQRHPKFQKLKENGKKIEELDRKANYYLDFLYNEFISDNPRKMILVGKKFEKDSSVTFMGKNQKGDFEKIVVKKSGIGERVIITYGYRGHKEKLEGYILKINNKKCRKRNIYN